MDSIMDKHLIELNADHADFDEKTRCYTIAANERLHGKTAIEMFICLEMAVDLARARNPNVAFRKYLHTALLGLLALQQAVGPWLDVSDIINVSHLASSCIWFPSFFNSTLSDSGDLSFHVSPIR